MLNFSQTYGNMGLIFIFMVFHAQKIKIIFSLFFYTEIFSVLCNQGYTLRRGAIPLFYCKGAYYEHY